MQRALAVQADVEELATSTRARRSEVEQAESRVRVLFALLESC